ncbi:MAG: flagellar motor protein MotB [Pseudomonadota bacterium]
MPRKIQEDIVYLRKKGAFLEDEEEGHGTWKIVYADFATAMMAFFLVMWFTTVVDEVQRDMLADYFNPVSISRSNSGADGTLAGRSTDTVGALTSAAAPGETAFPLASPPSVSAVGDDAAPPSENETAREAGANTDKTGAQDDSKRFAEIERLIRLRISKATELEGLADSILFEDRPEGLYIQITDQEGFSMFDVARARANERAALLLSIVGDALRLAPNHVRVSGHTDAAPFADGARYDNWELSADRANAARRIMVRAGLEPERIERVEGRASGDPLLPDNPADARNRRISVTLLRTVPASLDLFFDGR